MLHFFLFWGFATLSIFNYQSAKTFPKSKMKVTEWWQKNQKSGNFALYSKSKAPYLYNYP